MSEHSSARLAVMFTALSGIDQVARHDGDAASVVALQRLTDHLRFLAATNGGEVVDAIGSELFIVFERADTALQCACLMQKDVHQRPELRDPRVSLSVGMHYGAAIRKDTGVYGDSVNTAARVKSQCTPGRILMTWEAKITLPQQSRALMRPFDRVVVKGKTRPLTLFEALWAPEDLNKTSVISAMIDTGYLQDLTADSLAMRVAGDVKTLSSAMTPVTLGRSRQCDVAIDCSTASRLHCRIEHRRGKFVLIDTSTNGTHLLRSDGSQALLKREQAVLTGKGRFALGTNPEPGALCTIDFECD